MNLADNLIVKKESMPHKICLIEKDTKLNYFDLFKKVVEFSEYFQYLLIHSFLYYYFIYGIWVIFRS